MTGGGSLPTPESRGSVPAPSLGRVARVALRWNAAAAAATLASQAIQVVFLARWLSPSEYGLAAAALAVSAVLAGLADLGLTNALVQRESLSTRSWSAAWWATALAGAALALALLPAAPRVEAWIRLPGLAALLPLAALAVPLAGPAAVFQARLQRDLRLRRLAIVEILAALGALGIALAVGWHHRSPLALVAGQASLTALRFCGLWLASSFRPALALRWADLRPLASFGGYQLAERAVAHAVGNADRLVVAALLGPAAAGHYFMAAQLAMKPASLLGPFVSRTLLPLLSRIRGERERTASSYLRALSMLAAPAALAYALLVGLAEPLLALALGPGWDDTVLPLRLLAVAGLLAVSGNVLGNLTLALGRAGTSFAVNSGMLLANLAAIFLGARHGLNGIAFSLLIVSLLSLSVDLILPRLWLGVPPGKLVRAAAWPLPAAALAAGLAWWLCVRLTAGPFVELLLAGAVQCALLALAARLFHRERVRAAWRDATAAPRPPADLSH